MFITVLYGDNEEMLFNINCNVQLLLESIKRSCNYGNEGEVELADDTGQVKNLWEKKQCYASELLTERETCVLLAVTKAQDSSEVIFTPLLNDDAIVNGKFLERLLCGDCAGGQAGCNHRDLSCGNPDRSPQCLTKLGNWGESKDSSRKSKSKKSQKKATLVIPPSPEATGKANTSVRKRSVKP